MHQFACTDNGIHRTDVEALATTNAKGFINDGASAWFVWTKTRIEWFRCGMSQHGQALDRDTIARWTPINIGFTASDSFRIGTTARVAALRALRLWQPCVNLINGDSRLCLPGHG